MLDQWLTWARLERGLRPNTVQAYERELRRLHGYTQLETATSAHLRSFLYARGGKAASFAKRLAALRSFYGWLVRTEQRPDDPTRSIDRPKLHRGIPRPVDDLEDRLTALEGPFRQAAVLLAETGLRLYEA
ncbi:MAG: site-specific integrase, partial [Candidatus Methylomirabilales bacterium]